MSTTRKVLAFIGFVVFSVPLVVFFGGAFLLVAYSWSSGIYRAWHDTQFFYEALQVGGIVFGVCIALAICATIVQACWKCLTDQ